MTFMGRLSIRKKIVLLAGIPVLGTLILALAMAQHARTQTAAATALGSIDDVAQLSVHISRVMRALQLERARTALIEGFEEHGTATEASSLDRDRETTNAAEKQLELFLAGHDLSALPKRLARDLGVARVQAASRRQLHERLRREAVSIDDVLSFYEAAANALVSATAALTELSDDGELLRSISSLVALEQLTERASREHALLSYVFAAREFPPGAFKTLVTLTTEQVVYTDAFRANANGHDAQQFDAAQKAEPVVRTRALRDEVLNARTDDFNVDGRVWFDTSAGALAKLQVVEKALLQRITLVATRKLETTRASVRLGWSLSVLVVFVSGLLAWFIAKRVTRSIVDLSLAAAQVRQTNDFSIRAKKTSGDELGTLADTFNEMLAMIQARDTHLEAQVAERTEELRRTLAELWSEMDLALKIQTILLPQDPQLPNYAIAAKMVPASSVGGDYYDVFRIDGVDWILVGDVSGHGVTAGLSMMLVQTAVRTVIQSAGIRAQQITPKQLLSSVNAAVRSNLQKINPEQYMTIMALRLDRGKVSYAGLHQDVLVHRAKTNVVERIPTRGIWIGLVDDISELLDDDEFEMEDGDVLLLYTDGVTEVAANDNMLGTDGLASMLTLLASRSSIPTDVVQGVLDRVCVATLDDDVTVLAARYEAAGAKAAHGEAASTVREVVGLKLANAGKS
jgi:serine phosphatase RsbU (regulator of sigma subunit)